MNEQLVGIFEQIQRRAQDEAGAVHCSLAEYVEGLSVMADELTMAIDAAAEDLARQNKET